MTLIEKAFDVFLARISPPNGQLAAAKRSHEALQRFLRADEYFGAMIQQIFLNGSYARNTVIRPIKDVDIIVVVGPDWLDCSPHSAMESLRRKLAQRYDQRRTLRQRRAVRVTLFDMQLDVLLGVTDSGMDLPLWIPDRKQETWIKTHPKAQLALTSELDRVSIGNYTRLVRLLKAWSCARVASRYRPASFIIECAAYHVVRMEPDAFTGEISVAFSTLLDRLRAWDFGRADRWLPMYGPEVPDPALPKMNVAEHWTASEADQFRSRMDVALRGCDDVDRARWDDTAVKKWRQIFGDPFPSPTTVDR